MIVESKTYWPILPPDHPSWFTDLPSEGITIDSDGFISNCQKDAQGSFIRTNYDGVVEWCIDERPTKEYQLAQTKLFQVGDNLSNTAYFENACKVLEQLGWKEVVVDEEETEGRYFKYA